MDKLHAILSKPLLFHLFAFANLVPLWLTHWVGSLDGAQHLYIAQVIKQLWLCNPVFEQFYQFGSPAAGNQTGNLLLALFHAFLPAWLAEKMLLTSCLLGLAYAFRYLLVSMNGRFALTGFLIFPLSYHAFFLQGYYNFSIAFALMFFALGWWMKIKPALTLRNTSIMGLLLVLTYYTHLFVYGILLSLLALSAIARLIEIMIHERNKTTLLRWVRENTLLYFLALPGLVLAAIYYSLIPKSGPSVVETTFIADYLMQMRILVGFHLHDEMRATVPFLIFLILLTTMAVALRFIRSHKRIAGKGSALIQPRKDVWLLYALMLLVIIFSFSYKLPAGSVATRLILVMFLALITWLGIQQMPKWAEIASLIMVLFVSLSLRHHQHAHIRNLDHYISELLEIEHYIEENTVLMSVNFSQNWTHHHLKNYLGTGKAIVNLHTDAVSPYFVVDWNRQQLPDIYMGAQAIYRFNHYSHPYQSEEDMVMENIVVWGHRGFEHPDFEDLYKTTLLRDYDQVFVTSAGNGALYKLKSDFTPY